MGTEAHTPETGSYLAPRLEHARVADAMHHGILSCPADASLRDAARTMALHHVHMIVVTDPGDGNPVGCLTDSHLLRALLAPASGTQTLADVADRNFEKVSSGDPLSVAAALMRDDHADHLLVHDEQSGRPVGVLSTLDVAGVLAWGEA
jgi:CBS domain-containing protein